MQVAPARTLAGGSLSSPGKILAGTARPHPPSEPPSSPPTLQSRWDRVREAPPWWHADLCEDKEQSRSKEDRKATIPVEETHKAPRQDPCRGSWRAAARPLSGHPARPSPSAPARPLPGPHQPSSYRRSCAAANPTSWAGTCVAACRPSWRLHHRATSTAYLPTWRCMRCWPGHVLKPGGRQRTGRASPPSPDKVKDT